MIRAMIDPVRPNVPARHLFTSAIAALLLAAGAAPAEDRVYDAPEAVLPLAAGNPVPSVRVKTIGGEPIDLAEAMRDRGALLVFYRGGW